MKNIEINGVAYIPKKVDDPGSCRGCDLFDLRDPECEDIKEVRCMADSCIYVKELEKSKSKR